MVRLFLYPIQFNKDWVGSYEMSQEGYVEKQTTLINQNNFNQNINPHFL